MQMEIPVNLEREKPNAGPHRAAIVGIREGGRWKTCHGVKEDSLYVDWCILDQCDAEGQHLVLDQRLNKLIDADSALYKLLRALEIPCSLKRSKTFYFDFDDIIDAAIEIEVSLVPQTKGGVEARISGYGKLLYKPEPKPQLKPQSKPRVAEVIPEVTGAEVRRRQEELVRMAEDAEYKAKFGDEEMVF
jgi:hypothetical protein